MATIMLDVSRDDKECDGWYILLKFTVDRFYYRKETIQINHISKLQLFIYINIINHL